MEKKQVVKDAVRVAVSAAVQNPSIDAAPSAVAPIVEAVMRSPEVKNATNSEPWYQSRVTLGALGAIIGGVYTLILDFTDGSPPSVEVLTAQLGVIGSAALTLYGRWRAKRPLGE